MKKSKLVTVPKKWKTNELAYITPVEKKALLKLDLHGNLKDGPHKGPGGVTSLNGWGSDDPSQNIAGADITPAMDVSGSDPGWGGGATGTTGDKGTISAGGKKVAQGAATLFSLSQKSIPLSWAWSGVKKVGSLFKPKTEQQKSEKFTKQGFDILNPSEMKSAKKTYKDFSPAENGGGGRQITFDTQALASTAIPETKKSTGWGFKAYQPGTTANTRLYGKKGKMVKANQGQFSQGKRFGPPPKKGPDPQGIDAPLNSIDYFKDLL